MDGQAAIAAAMEMDRLLEGPVAKEVRTAVGPLIFWAAIHIGAARIGKGLMDRLGTQGGYEQVRQLLSDEPFDTMEAAALSFASRSVVTALDLCAASIYRLAVGPDLHREREADVGTWNTALLIRVKPEVDQAEWLWGLAHSAEWSLLEGVRHGMTHRRFARTIKVTIGSDRIPDDDIEVGGTKYPMNRLAHRFCRFGEEQFAEFCAGLRRTYLGDTD